MPKQRKLAERRRRKNSFALNKWLKSFFADKTLQAEVIEGDDIELEYTHAGIVREKM